jgi:uncharacterized protein YidB (DUF937 family)
MIWSYGGRFFGCRAFRAGGDAGGDHVELALNFRHVRRIKSGVGNMLDKLIGAALQGLAGGGQGGGGSPIMNIIMQLLMQQMSGGRQQAGGLGGILGGLLGGGRSSPSGGGNPLEALAGMLAGGGQQGGGALGQLLQQFQGAGLSREADSWVSTGPNIPLSPDALTRVFGREKLQGLAQEHGMDLGSVLHGLSQQLPEVVNQMTPQGRLPQSNELQDLLGKFMGSAR